MRRSSLPGSGEERRGLTLAEAGCEIRADGGEGAERFIGHAAVFDVRTAIGNPLTWGFYEEIAPGAFTKTLSEGDARMLIDHDSYYVVSRASASTLNLAQDKVGLAVDSALDPGLSYVSDLKANLRNENITGMSFGFYVKRDEWTTETVETSDGQTAEVEVRRITEIQLVEVSAVTFPAYEDTDAGLRAAVVPALRRRGDPDAIARRTKYRPELAELLDDVVDRAPGESTRGDDTSTTDEDDTAAPGETTQPNAPSIADLEAVPPLGGTASRSSDRHPTPTDHPAAVRAVGMPERSTTMSRLNELVERQQKLWSRMQEIQRAAEDEKRDWNAEERTNWDAANAELDTVSGDIERLNRAARLEAADERQRVEATAAEDLPEGQETDEQRGEKYREAFTTYLRHGLSDCTPEQRTMLHQGFVKNEDRALGQATGAAGGYTVPEEFRATMTETMKAFGGLLALANVITTSTGAPLPWPTNDDTGNTGAILGENTQIGEQDFSFGESQLGAYTYTSKLVRVPWTLLDDSAFNLETWLPPKLGERIGRAQAPHLVSGTGTNQPTGILSAATAGAIGAVSAQAAITFDNLVDLEHSVDPAYRSSSRCGYVFADDALKLIRKVKDADGRPMWQPIPAPGFPPTVNGWGYTIDNSMAAPAPGQKSILFGDIYAGLIVRQVKGVQLVRLSERYADYLQTGFFAFSRMDAKPDDSAAVRAFQHGAAA